MRRGGTASSSVGANIELGAYTNLHGLRHGYAQRRYKALTGWDCPKVGGPKRSALTADQRPIDDFARQVISEELGHSRLEITKVYLGG